MMCQSFVVKFGQVAIKYVLQKVSKDTETKGARVKGKSDITV